MKLTLTPKIGLQKEEGRFAPSLKEENSVLQAVSLGPSFEEKKFLGLGPAALALSPAGQGSLEELA